MLCPSEHQCTHKHTLLEVHAVQVCCCPGLPWTGAFTCMRAMTSSARADHLQRQLPDRLQPGVQCSPGTQPPTHIQHVSLPPWPLLDSEMVYPGLEPDAVLHDQTQCGTHGVGAAKLDLKQSCRQYLLADGHGADRTHPCHSKEHAGRNCMHIVQPKSCMHAQSDGSAARPAAGQQSVRHERAVPSRCLTQVMNCDLMSCHCQLCRHLGLCETQAEPAPLAQGIGHEESVNFAPQASAPDQGVGLGGLILTFGACKQPHHASHY